MYPALVIASKFVERSIKEKALITHMKLQKLIYIANGIHLALYEEPLIIESIRALPYGPVIVSIYDDFKVFGSSFIEANLIFPSKSVKLNKESQKSFDDAWQIGKDVDAIKLSNWTHNTDSPWSKAKEENLNIIPDRYMKDYFTKFLSVGV